MRSFRLVSTIPLRDIRRRCSSFGIRTTSGDGLVAAQLFDHLAISTRQCASISFPLDRVHSALDKLVVPNLRKIAAPWLSLAWSRTGELERMVNAGSSWGLVAATACSSLMGIIRPIIRPDTDSLYSGNWLSSTVKKRMKKMNKQVL